MKNKIFIIEKEIATINSISTLVTALNFERIVFYNYSARIKSYALNEIAAIFLNIEIPMISVEKVVDEFYNNQNQRVPIFYLYKRTNSKEYDTAMRLKHTAELRKPFQLEDLYLLMDKYLNLDDLPVEQLAIQDKTQEFRRFYEESRSWLDKYKELIGS